MFSDSIRWRLQLWLGFLLVCLMSGFGVAMNQLQSINTYSQIDEELERRIAAIMTLIRARGPGEKPGMAGGPRRFSDREREHRFDEGGPQRPPPAPPNSAPGSMPPHNGGPFSGPGVREFEIPELILALFHPADPLDHYFIVYGRSGTIHKASANAPTHLPAPNPSRDSLVYSRMRDHFRESFQFTGFGECVLVGRSITRDLQVLQSYNYRLIAAGSTIVILGLAVGWWLTTRAIKPIETISQAATRIAEGNLQERIHVANPHDELGHLARVLNTTFARLEAAFERQRQFTADASHELRTPLAILISEAQTTLHRPRNAAEYRESLETCLATAQQMRRLAESLLELSRIDNSPQQSPRSLVHLHAVVEPMLERLELAAKQQNITLQSDLQPAQLESDPDRIAQVLTNLVTNAIAYNRPGGTVHVSTSQGDGLTVLKVTDTGIGISPEDLPHVFERFYRVDKARTRAQGHAGLGLAICKAIVESDGGSLTVTSKPGEGSIFTASWPTCLPSNSNDAPHAHENRKGE